MGTAGRRKVQVFSSDVVEDLRSLLAQKTTEPVPQPDSFMIGAVIQTLTPSSDDPHYCIAREPADFIRGFAAAPSERV
jgi:hypothetical protein